MIEATVAMAAMAGLFVLFGALRLADRGGEEGGCGGCGACSDACSAGGSCPVDLVDPTAAGDRWSETGWLEPGGGAK